MIEEIYIVEGMSCAACSSAVERVTRKLEGVDRSDVNLTTNRMTIYYDETKVTPEIIMAKVKKAGFGIKPFLQEEKNELEFTEGQENTVNESTSKSSKISAQEKERKTLNEHKKNLISASIFTALLLYVSMGQMLVDNLPIPLFMDMDKYPTNFALTQLILTIPVMWFGRKFFIVGLSLPSYLNVTF